MSDHNIEGSPVDYEAIKGKYHKSKQTDHDNLIDDARAEVERLRLNAKAAYNPHVERDKDQALFITRLADALEAKEKEFPRWEASPCKACGLTRVIMIEDDNCKCLLPTPTPVATETVTVNGIPLEVTVELYAYRYTAYNERFGVYGVGENRDAAIKDFERSFDEFFHNMTDPSKETLGESALKVRRELLDAVATGGGEK